MQEESFRTGCRFWPRRKGPFFLAGGVGYCSFELWDVGEVRGELSQLSQQRQLYRQATCLRPIEQKLQAGMGRQCARAKATLTAGNHLQRARSDTSRRTQNGNILFGASHPHSKPFRLCQSGGLCGKAQPEAAASAQR